MPHREARARLADSLRRVKLKVRPKPAAENATTGKLAARLAHVPSVLSLKPFTTTCPIN